MGVWDDLDDPEYHARILLHPSLGAVGDRLFRLVEAVRRVRRRDETLAIQEELLGLLIDAEERRLAARRLLKRGEGDRWEHDFWRRVTVQLRSIGDAIAWKFLDYNRQAILLIGANQRPGLLVGKAGTAGEIEVFRARWAEGLPTLLLGLTNQLTTGDLIVDEGDSRLRIVEVKHGKAPWARSQRIRMLRLEGQLGGTARIDGPGGPTYIMQSDVPMRSFWADAAVATERASVQPLSTWVPTPGVAALFTNVSAMTRGGENPAAQLKREQDRAAAKMGPMTHRVVVTGSSWPYRTSRPIPPALIPIPANLATGILLGTVLIKVEVSVDSLVREMEAAGFQAAIALDEADTDLTNHAPMINWRRGAHRGQIHPAVLEQLAIELVPPTTWIAGFRSLVAAEMPERYLGAYLCLANESAVWM